MNGSLTIRIDNEIKQLAAKNAKQLGLDLSTVIRMLRWKSPRNLKKRQNVISTIKKGGNGQNGCYFR
ncbi:MULTISPECIES: hypothetical protein [Rodentibacter]|uniref:hypothetical protein n=1 Tax=Rodentibacter TaxID=1960084 RepID=UPI001CFEDEFF|nr:hypothetical protein [Rodentibacter sp. JRC1]GJI56826.1 hypothetical protein HEMROJRC1_19380 [Rodentibacter sp. JRC1]